MPTYAYRCRDCGHQFDIFQKFSEDSLTICPSCEGSIRRVIQPTGIVFKGTGFYINDSKNGSKSGADKAKTAAGGAALEFEPSEEAILATLLPRNLTVQVYRALLENAASEQGARMSAMDSATRNAGEMIKKQTQVYNRTRQAMITKELIEIISGAEAL